MNESVESVGGLLKIGRERLKDEGVDTYSLDALVLLAFALGKPKEWVLANSDAACGCGGAYMELVSRRESGVPIAYITNNREFMGIDFYVDENVLIPRCDTEILVERVIEASRKHPSPKILDLCTGSGCIAVSIMYYNEEARVHCADICEKALKIAQRNAVSAGVSHRAEFFLGNLLEAVPNGEKYDIIVSNPPYITKDEMKTLPADVLHEPEKALYGGNDGLDFYRNIAGASVHHINEGGKLFFEIGAAQAEDVSKIMYENGFVNIRIYKDLAGKDRALEGECVNA